MRRAGLSTPTGIRIIVKRATYTVFYRVGCSFLLI